MSTASDAELAHDHGVSRDYVRALRDQMERDALSADILAAAREIARLTGSPMPLSKIIRRAMQSALRRTQRATQRREKARPQATGVGHSVGRTMRRSPVPAEAREGSREIGTRDGRRREASLGAPALAGGMRDG